MSIRTLNNSSPSNSEALPKANGQSSTMSTITNTTLDYIAKVGVSTCDNMNELVLRSQAANRTCKKVSERYEFQRIGERTEQNLVVKRYESNGQIYTTYESVYKPGHLELRPTKKLISDEFLEAFSKVGPQTETRSLTDVQWDNITRQEAIVGVSTVGTAAASLCALVAYCYFNMFK